MSASQNIKSKLIENYWDKKLQNEHIITSVKAKNLEELTVDIEPSSSDAIFTMSKQNPLAEYIIYLSCYQFILSKFFRLTDICVLTSDFLQDDQGFRNAHELYISTKISPEVEFKQFITSVREDVLQTLKYREFEAKDVFKYLAEKRLERVGLFSAFGFCFDQVNVDEVSVKKCPFQFALSKLSDGKLQMSLRYDTTQYERITVERFVNTFQILISKIKEIISEPIGTLNYLSQIQMNQLFTEFNKPLENVNIETSIVELFEEQARRSPDRIAVVYENSSLTYRELNHRSNELAAILVNEYSVQPNQLIGLMLDRSVQMIVATLGILKSGAAYLPIDPTYPEERIRYIIEDSKTNILVTDSNYMFGFEEQELAIIAVDIQLTGNFSANIEPLKNNPDDLSYVIYTSGSTGKPKGVSVQHKSIVNTILNQISIFGVHDLSSVLQFASISFDAAVSEIFMGLCSGAKLVILPDELKENLSRFNHYLELHQVSVATLPPSFLTLVKDDLPESLDVLITAGEAAIPADMESLKDKMTCFNAYGPTENAICTTIYKVSCDQKYRSVPIGKPIPNMNVYLLDQYMQPVPVGVPGEIYSTGLGVASGYIHQDELTEERFIENPFVENSLYKLYKTGDLGRWTPDGNIEFLGRTDHQVKLRGFRIELGEIERQVIEVPEIDEVVVLISSEPNAQELIAFCVCNQAFQLNKLRNFLTSKLPDYMIPSKLILLDQMPLTHNGKIDRKELTRIEQAQTTRSTNYVAPETDLQQALVEIWTDTLKKADIGIKDDFFELGGHSLKATQIATRICKELEADIQLIDIFNHPTIEELEKRVLSSSKKAFESITAIDEYDCYEVSQSQRRLWVIDQLGDAKHAYNIPGSYPFFGEFKPEIFEQALRKVIARHESLRTTFLRVNGKPKQKIHALEAFPFSMDYIDLRELDDQEEKIKEYEAFELNEAFDLEKGPLLRAKMLQLADESYLLLFTMHHIISDARSQEVLVEEVTHYYQQTVDGLTDTLAPLKIHYKDFAAWQNRLLEGTKTSSDEEYWINQFSGEIPVIELPTDSPRPPIKTFSGSRVGCFLSNEARKKLVGHSQSAQASTFMGLLTLVNIFLYKYSGQTDIILGTAKDGRNHEDLKNQIGFYINTLAFRTRFKQSETFENLLKQVKTNTLQGYEHQNYPFDWLVEKLDLHRDPSRSPLFDVMVDYETREGFHGDVSDQPFKIEYEAGVTSKFDLRFLFVDGPQGLYVVLQYNDDMWTRKRMETMLCHFYNLVNTVVEQMDVPIQELTMVSETEKETLCNTFNQPEINITVEETFRQAIERSVVTNHENTALSFEGTVLTYAELNEKANRIAYYFRDQLALKANDRVAICLEHTPELVISLLAALKSGVAYVPIDPVYPMERIEFILSDAEAKALVTDSARMFDFESFEGDIFAVDLQLSELPQAIDNLEEQSELQDSAYVIYTSGSTGQPKGVELSIKNLMNYLLWANAYYFNSTNSHIFPLFTSIAFDLTLTSIFTTLLRGDTLVIYPEVDVVSNLSSIFSVETSVNSVKLTPAHVSALGKLNITSTNVQTVILGGEAIKSEHIETLKTLNPDMKIYNEYGPTETTVGSTVYDIGAQETLIPIGKPISNTQIFVLNEAQRLQPIGVPGELYIGGDGVCKSYLNRADLNEQRFIENPFGKGKLYRTGDLGYWNFNGELALVGRIDDQVKIRGYRIELGEIEAALVDYPSISNSVVLTKELNAETQLWAYFVSPEEINISELRQFLSNRLPLYMVPNKFVLIEDLPLTSNGKVDKRKLLEVTNGELDLGSTYFAPATDIETRLVEIWTDILGKERIGTKDNFFDLGGNSMNLIQMHQVYETEFPEQVTVAELFQFNTIEALALKLEGTDVSLKNSDDKEILGFDL